MNEDNLAKQEESVRKQEAMKRGIYINFFVSYHQRNKMKQHDLTCTSDGNPKTLQLVNQLSFNPTSS